MAGTSTIRVLLVDDHPLMRKGIRAMLEEHDDVIVVGEASNGLEAISYARTHDPTVIIMDINMPHMDGMQATRLIKQSYPTMTIIALSVNETASVKHALMHAGATAFVNKDKVGDDLYQTMIGLLTCVGSIPLAPDLHSLS